MYVFAFLSRRMLTINSFLYSFYDLHGFKKLPILFFISFFNTFLIRNVTLKATCFLVDVITQRTKSLKDQNRFRIVFHLFEWKINVSVETALFSMMNLFGSTSCSDMTNRFFEEICLFLFLE